MGYERLIKPTNEALEELKKYVPRTKSKTTEKCKAVLLAYCMLDNSDKQLKTLYDDISFHLGCIEYSVREECFTSAVDEIESDNNISFCGYKYSGDVHSNSEAQSFRDYAVRELMLLACVVKTPDYFNDSDSFFEKTKDIMSLVDDYISEYIDVVNYEIIDILKKFGSVDCEDCEECDEDCDGESGSCDNPNVFVCTCHNNHVELGDDSNASEDVAEESMNVTENENTNVTEKSEFV